MCICCDPAVSHPLYWQGRSIYQLALDSGSATRDVVKMMALAHPDKSTDQREQDATRLLQQDGYSHGEIQFALGRTPAPPRVPVAAPTVPVVVDPVQGAMPEYDARGGALDEPDHSANEDADDFSSGEDTSTSNDSSDHTVRKQLPSEEQNPQERVKEMPKSVRRRVRRLGQEAHQRRTTERLTTENTQPATDNVPLAVELNRPFALSQRDQQNVKFAGYHRDPSK